MATSTVYNFFATPEDIIGALRFVEASYPLQYVSCGLFDDSKRPVFQDSSSLPGLGVAQNGESHLEPTFLVMLKGTKLKMRTVEQRRGGSKYAVDQQANPGTVIIRPGGLYKNSTLIAGMVGTVHRDEKAIKLIKVFSDALKRDFTKVKSYFVGPKAKELLQQRARLTHSIHASTEFDLSA